MQWHDRDYENRMSNQQNDCDHDNWGPQFEENQNGQYENFCPFSNFSSQGQY